MRLDYVDITLLIDKSGSMEHLTNDTIGGVNRMLHDQRLLPGEARLTMVQFDTTYNFVHTGVRLDQVPNLTHLTYHPGGSTALLDAMGRAIIETGKRLADMPEAERPARVLFVAITDGEENASREVTKDQLRRMVEEQTNVYKWEFVYLGANVDAFSEAGAVGVAHQNVANYGANQAGVAAVYSIMSDKIGQTRRAAFQGDLSVSMAFTPDEQAAFSATVDQNAPAPDTTNVPTTTP